MESSRRDQFNDIAEERFIKNNNGNNPVLIHTHNKVQDSLKQVSVFTVF